LIVALAIRLDSKGPIFFRQNRIGFSGRTFQIYKFRTMITMDNGDVVRQASRNDKRVTRVGRLLRRSSIDELPQLLNVLQGEMSLVGPRPHAVAHDNEYDKLIAVYALRHHMKPGITGWAQVNGCRGETPTLDSMRERVEHDIWYINNWSLWLDIVTLFRTVLELARSRNAY
jgi:exopolysaccharide biosynthesis polyprenyl glycosylphosphotransferase